MSVGVHNERVHRDYVWGHVYHENYIGRKYADNVKVKTCVVCL